MKIVHSKRESSNKEKDSFTLKELLKITELEQHQIRFLFREELMIRLKPPDKYTLSDLIYCRLFYWLVQLYGKRAGKLLNPRLEYLDWLTYRKYGEIKFTKMTSLEMTATDELEEPELAEELDRTIFLAGVKQVPDKYQGHIEVNYCYFNLERIKEEVAPPPKAA